MNKATYFPGGAGLYSVCRGSTGPGRIAKWPPHQREAPYQASATTSARMTGACLNRSDEYLSQGRSGDEAQGAQKVRQAMRQRRPAPIFVAPCTVATALRGPWISYGEDRRHSCEYAKSCVNAESTKRVPKTFRALPFAGESWTPSPPMPAQVYRCPQ